MGKQVVVSDGVYELIKTFVIESSGTFHKGSIKQTVENAIRYYLRIEHQRRENTHAHAQEKFHITKEEQQHSKVPKKLLNQRDEIVTFLEREYYPEADLLKKYEITRLGVNLAHLKQAIAFVIGPDPRTVKGALDRLSCYHLIKELDTNRFEFAPFYDDLLRQMQNQKQAADSAAARQSGFHPINDDVQKWV